MTIDARIRGPLYSSLILTTLLCLGAGILLAVSSLSSLRLLAVLGSGFLFAFGAWMSGNPRLLLLWGLGFSIPFMFAKTIGEVINKGGGEVAFNLDITDIFLGLLSVYILRDLWTGRRSGIRLPLPAFFWAAIMLFGVAAIIVGPYRSVVAFEVFRMLKMLVLFLVLTHELTSPTRLLHWCGALTSGMIVNALVGLAEFHYKRTFGLADLGEAGKDVIDALAATSLEASEIWRVGAFLGHPNVFGEFLAVTLPITMACFMLCRGKLPKLYFLIAFVLGCAALGATYSRSGWFGFVVGFAGLLLAMFGHSGLRRRSLIASVFLILLLFAGLFAVRGQIAERLFESRAEAVEFRQVFNEDAKRMINDAMWWGLGLNTYVLHVPTYARYSYGNWPAPVHQTYYLWWAETGLIGLLLHLAMWAAIFWFGARNFRVRDARMFAINAACFVGMIAFAMDGFVSFSLRITPTLKTYWVVAAMIMAIHYWRLRWERTGVRE